jgi:uncharacterized protein YbaR (Trm112 family)
VVSDDLIQILVCPETRQPVTRAPADVVDALNEQIRRGTLRDKGGQPVEGPIEAGLLRQDGQVLYPVIDDIPRMLIERGIPVQQSQAGGP